MPLLDRQGKGEAVSGGVSYSVSHTSENYTSRHVEGTRSHSANRRQKIIVVGLGMVAISFMYV